MCVRSQLTLQKGGYLGFLSARAPLGYNITTLRPQRMEVHAGFSRFQYLKSCYEPIQVTLLKLLRKHVSGHRDFLFIQELTPTHWEMFSENMAQEGRTSALN